MPADHPRPSSQVPASEVVLTVDGVTVAIPDDGLTLLEALRGPVGARSAKDGCSPQGQCGCCTVLVDGSPRVSCVTPLRRVAGRDVQTFDGLDDAIRERWSRAFLDHGASQCGFCSPGIVVRLEALRRTAAAGASLRDGAVDRALAAHLCRCTGWQTIAEAAAEVLGEAEPGVPADGEPGVAVAAPQVRVDARDLDAAGRRATLELGAPQRVSPVVAEGAVGFSADTAPDGCAVAVPDPSSPAGWVLGDDLVAARRAAGKVQGRRTTVEPEPPLTVPDGEWDLTLRTSWVDAAYVETDAAWCEPGGQPSPAAANGGAFGAKRHSPVPDAARRLADEQGRPVLALWSREDCTRLAPKRPPVAAGVRSDGTGVLRVVRTEGIEERIREVAPGLEVVQVDVTGPRTSSTLRAAGWAEAVVLVAGVGAASDVVSAERLDDGVERVRVATAEGAVAVAEVRPDGIRLGVECGELLDEVTVRSYCIGASHMAFSWVTSEGLAVSADGEVLDLTVRSFGVLKAADTPRIEVTVDAGSAGGPVRVSDAVFAAVAAATWRSRGCPQDWPTG